MRNSSTVTGAKASSCAKLTEKGSVKSSRSRSSCSSRTRSAVRDGVGPTSKVSAWTGKSGVSLTRKQGMSVSGSNAASLKVGKREIQSAMVFAAPFQYCTMK